MSLRFGGGSAEFDGKRLILIVISGEKENLKVLAVRKVVCVNRRRQDLICTYIHIRRYLHGFIHLYI